MYEAGSPNVTAQSLLEKNVGLVEMVGEALLMGAISNGDQAGDEKATSTIHSADEGVRVQMR